MDWVALYAAGRNVEAKPLLEEQVAHEQVPGMATLYLGAVRTLLDHDRRHLDIAIQAARSNVRQDLLASVAGSTLWDIGLHTEGAELLRKAITIDPNPQNLGVAASRFDKIPAFADEAICLHDRIIACDPRNVPALVGRGGTKVAKSMVLLDHAEHDFKAAICIDPHDPYANYEMGNLLATLGDYREGLEYFKASVEFGHREPHCAQAGIALCLQRLGKLDEAAQAANAALRISPDYKYARDLLAEIEEETHRGTSQHE